MRTYLIGLLLLLWGLFFALPAVALVVADNDGLDPDAIEEEDPAASELAALEAARIEKILVTLEMLEAKGDVDGVVSLYLKGLAFSPTDLTLRERYTDVGIAVIGYALRHKADLNALLDLLDEYEHYLGTEATLPSGLWWFRAVALGRLDRADEAKVLRQQALAYKPGDSEYHRRVGYLLLTTDLYEEAIIELEAALATATDDWDRALCVWAIASAHFRVERYEEAADQYERAIALFQQGTHPRNFETLVVDAASALYHLGRYYELRGKLEKMIEANERALELLPDEPSREYAYATAQNLGAIGDAYIQLDKPKKALEVLERAQKLVPDSPGILTSLGDAYTKLGKEDEANTAYAEVERLYRDVIELRPGHPLGYNNLAWFFATHDMKLDEALKLSLTSIELNPKEEAYLDTLAEIYFRKGDFDKALEWINKAFELDPKPRHLLYYEQQRDKFQKAKEKNS